MKKIYNILMAAAIALGTFTSCEDVPMPFNNPLDYLEPDPEEVVIEPAGDGTQDSPFNVAGVLAYLETLGPDVESTKDIYITGVVTSVKEAFSTQYGNAQFVISDTDEAPNQFTFYRGLYLGNKKYSNENDVNIQEDDVVVICGKIVLYRGSTPETVQNKAYVVSINGKGESVAPKPTGTPKGSGTLNDPYNATAANAYIATLAAGAESDKDIYVKGKVSSIKEAFTTQYGNASFYLSDNGDDKEEQFYVFRTLYLGNKKYTEGDQIKAGDEIIVCGKVVNYMGNTPETAANKSYVYSLNGKTEGGGGGSDTPSGDATPISIADFNAAAVSDVWYQLTGTVKNLKEGDLYGNFDLEDATGSVYVYGLLSEKGGEKKKFQDLVTAKGIKEGCKLTIIGNRGEYNGKIEVMNAYFVSIEGGAEPSGGGGEGGGSAVSTLTNGDFETWANGLPTGWKSASTASNATLSQSTNAHGGSYAVIVAGDEGANKRLASQEMTLEAGTYNFSFYAKATTADAAQTRPGYVPVADGKVGSYTYGDYVNINNDGWTLVSYNFTLETTTTVCLVVMNPKKSNYSSGKDLLIDDATLTKK